ncbi:FAD-dependent oxidoreductase [Chloroflexota bacterium]
MKQKFPRLMQPFEIRQVKLRNRIVNPAHGRRMNTVDGYVTEEMIASYEVLAAGGVGLIIVAMAIVDFPMGCLPKRGVIVDDSYVSGLSKLAEAIHKQGCPVFLQLGHTGPGQKKKDFNLQPVSSSALSAEELPVSSYDPARELTIAEIEELVDKFAKGAERAKKAGFDGVEPHGAHNYLINSFLSPIWNRRQDAYGCQDRESRARFGLEVIREIRKRVGRDFPVGIRINGREWGHPRGITSEDSQAFAMMFEEAGADYISVSGYGFGPYLWMHYPDQVVYPEPAKEMAHLVHQIKKTGALVPAAEAIKKVVSVPVMVSGRLGPELGEWILKEGKADLTGMVRRLLADPQLPNKIASGRGDEIAPCTACFECVATITEAEPIHCRINATLGRELEYVIKPAEKKKKVMVIGGGPAGMEAARVAALRGHEVTLYEKEPKLGGLLPVAALVKGIEIEDIPGLSRYLSTQIDKLGIKVNTGQKADSDLIDRVKPDTVILATGGVVNIPGIPGINKSIVVNGADLHHRLKSYLRFLSPGFLRWLTKFYLPLGKRVVIMGGLIQGCQLAEFLVKRGRQVTIVETSDELGVGVPDRNRVRLIYWLEKKGVTMLTGVKYEEVTAKGLTITTREGQQQTIAADNVLTALPLRPNRELYQSIDGKVPEAYLVGDSAEGSKIIDAINDGFRIGRAI